MYEANLRICTVPVLLLQVHRIFSCAPGKVHEKINGHRSSLSELLDASDVCSAVRNGLASVRCRKQSIKWLQGIVSFFKRQAAMCSVKAVLAVGVLAYASFDPHRLLGDFSKKVATPIPLSAGIIKALAYYCRWNQLENLEFQYIFSNRNHPGLELTEAWPSVTALSPLSPPAQTAQAVLSCWWSKTAALWTLGAGVVLMTWHISLLMVISNLPPLTLCQSFICPFYLPEFILKGTILWLLVLVSNLFTARSFQL